MTETILEATNANTSSIKIEPSWKTRLFDEFQKPYMHTLRVFLKGQKEQRKNIFPKNDHIFYAFDCTPFEQVKVVILGQDPYHGIGQAHGLCFSVQKGVALPPSLQNIYKELKADLGITPPKHGCLESWAKQGVLLLNSVLTVEADQAASHQGKGWETFTDQVIKKINDEKEHVVFVLWGSYAQKKGLVIDETKHLVLRAPHPSPLSAHRGFLGSRPFSQINSYLESHHITPINWSIPDA